MRTIDADELKKQFSTDVPYGAGEISIIIDNAPTVEAYPFEQVQELVKLNQQFAQEIENLKRPQGEWVDEGQYAEGHSEHAYFCKNCDYQIIEKPNMISENRFCKNCGAEMKGGAENGKD